MKQALIVVDYQNDFVTGALGSPEAAGLEAAICGRIEAVLQAGGDLIFTFDTHGTDYLQTQEGRHLPIEHCLKGSGGWQLYGRAAAYQDRAVRCFEKETFGSLELAEYLRGRRYDRVELCGVVSHICVVSNAVLAKAALPQAEIVVDAACTAGSSPALHRAALDLMEGLQMTVLHHGQDAEE